MLVIDGSHLLHRIKFALPENFIPNWQYFSYSFLTAALSTMKMFKDKKVVVAWDKKGSYRRKRVYSDYKKREPIDVSTPDGAYEKLALEEYVHARQWLHDNAKIFGFASIMIPGLEADDIAFGLTNYVCKDDSGILMTEDRDWIQSLTPNFKLYRPISEKTITYDNVIEDYSFANGLSPSKCFAFIKSAEGDGSDNISGIDGIGYSFAKKFLMNIFNDGIMEFPGKKGAIFSENLQKLIDNYQLISFDYIRPKELSSIKEEFSKAKNNWGNRLDILSCIELSSTLDSQNALNFHSYYEF